MDEIEAAAAAKRPIERLASWFLVDPGLYEHGASLGFAGLDVYVCGRGGLLGETTGDVVAAAFIFFEPGMVRRSWESGASVMPRAQAATELAGRVPVWTAANLGEEVHWARLAELAGRMIDAANPAGAPLFAGWRQLDEPAGSDHAAVAIHRINALRELQGARHGGALLATGLHPAAAMAANSPAMAPLFGWQEADLDVDIEAVREVWKQADGLTNRAMAPVYEPLDSDERAEFVELVTAAHRVAKP